ncbi:MAG: gas vesicle protein K [Vicinamibacteria bacterium]
MKRAPKPARKKTAAAAPRQRRAPAKRRASFKARFEANPQDVERSLAKLVLSLVEFLRQVMERQAVRRMDEDTLTPDEIESMGVALMQLEKTLHELADRFGLTPADLHLDLGPLGRLT